MKSLSVDGLSISFGEIRISGNFQAAPGEVLVLRGPSGCGKSTLLRAMSGFCDGVVQGRVTGDRVAPEKRNIGWMTQSPVFFPGMTVLDSIAFPLRVRRLHPKETQERALAWLERLGLGAHASVKPMRLSGGERQRLSFGRALIFGPEFMFLDEPFSALDGENRHRMLSVLDELPAPQPPVVMSLHGGLEGALRNYRVSEVTCKISEEGRHRAFER